MSTFTQAGRALSVTTPLEPDALLLEGLAGREGISTLFRFKLDMLAEAKKTIPFERLLGQKLLVKLTHGPNRVRYFGGICSQFRQGAVLRGPDGTDLVRYHAELAPQLWLLTRRAQSRIFQQQSVTDILKVVLDGLDIDFRFRTTYPQRNYCVQFRESDFAFISRLMEEEGIYYYFEHDDKGHRLIVADLPRSHPTLAPPFDVLTYAGAAGAGSGAAVLGWEKEQELSATRYVVRESHFEIPQQPLEASAVMLQSVQVGNVSHALNLPAFGNLEVYQHPEDYASRFDGIGPGGSEQPDQLQAVFQDNPTAQLLMERAAIHSLRIEGQSDCVGLAAGYLFTMTDHPQGTGEYLLLQVEHDVSLPGFRSGRQEPLAYENRFVCWPKGERYRPPLQTPRPRIHGTQTATVTGTTPGEIYTDKHGRIKVRFHWDRKPADDLSTSCWIRVMQPWAGQGWGALHLPRVGQEVVVDFLDGNPDRPIVLGSVYNGEQLPPYELPAQRMVSGLRSRSLLSDSSQDYNELRFDDTKGAEELSLTAQRDMTTTVEHDFNQTVEHDASVTVHNNTTWHLGNGPLTMNFVATWNNIEINKLTKTVVSSVSHADVAALQAKLYGARFMGVAGLNAEIDLAKYEKVLSRSFESCGAKTLTTRGDLVEAVGKDRIETVVGNHVAEAGSHKILAKDGLVRLHGKQVYLDTGTPGIALNEGKVAIHSGKSIQLVFGRNVVKLELTASGLSIDGGNITLTGKQMIKLSAPQVIIDSAPAPAPGAGAVQPDAAMAPPALAASPTPMAQAAPAAARAAPPPAARPAASPSSQPGGTPARPAGSPPTARPAGPARPASPQSSPTSQPSSPPEPPAPPPPRPPGPTSTPTVDP